MLLESLGLGLEVVAPEVEELREGAPPAELVVENARRKARFALERVAPKECLVLGCDTEVVLDGQLLGKPANPHEAGEHLRQLSGRTHEVLSGLVILRSGLAERSGAAATLVTFRELDPGEIELYLASGEWRDRAGGYAVQGLGSSLVGGLQGDLSNVIGLPIALLRDLAPELARAAKIPQAEV